MDVMAQFNLPSYLKNKTFSEASKIIDNKFKDRTDPESIATLNELQGRLQKAQEHVKAEQLKLSQPSGASTNSPLESLGAGASATEPHGDNKMFLGGLLGGQAGGQMGGQAQGGLAGFMGGANKVMGAAGGAADLAKMAFGSPNIDTSGRTAGPEIDMAGTIAGGAMKGMEAGNSIVPGVGGLVGGAIGGLAGLVGGNKAKKKADKARYNNTLFQHKELSNRYVGGGPLTTDPTDPNDIDFMQANDTAMSLDGGGIRNIRPKAISLIDKLKLETKPVAELTGAPTIENPVSTAFNGEDFKKQAANKFNPAALLRYAPAVMNLAQLGKNDSPAEVGLDKLGTKYDKQLVDEQGIQNTVRNATASNRDAILSSSGGSGSAARANLLASQLQGTKALSNAYQQANAENRQEGRREQDFNLGVDQFNIGQSNREEQINAQNSGAHSSNKSRLMAALGNDLGGIGKEELLKRFPELMGLGYNWQGKKTS